MWPISRHPKCLGPALLFGTVIACGLAASGGVAIAQSTIIQRTDSIIVEPVEPGTEAPTAAPSSSRGGNSSASDSGIVDIPDGTVDGQLPPVPTAAPASNSSQGRDWEFDSLESASGGFGEGETRAALGIVGTVSNRDIPRDPDALDRWHAIHNVCDGHLSLGELTALFPSIDSALVEEVCQ